MEYNPPYPPYDPEDKNGYETVVKRWPIILTSLIDTVQHEIHLLSSSKEKAQQNHDHIAEGKAIINTIKKLKEGMARNNPLDPIPDDNEPNVTCFNELLVKLSQKGAGKWFTAPWLYAEHDLTMSNERYMNITLDIDLSEPTFLLPNPGKPTTLSTLKKLKHLNLVPLPYTVISSFESKFDGLNRIPELAHTFTALGDEKEALDEIKLEILYKEMLHICLWGNATDLSLLTNMTHEDIQKLQVVERNAQEARKEFILLDQSDDAWNLLRSSKSGRVDIVLDNSGFELFTDLLLADFLVSYTPYVSQVVFHPKTSPWFVSDVTPVDFYEMFPLLSSETFFNEFLPSPEQRTELEELVQRWQNHLNCGKFSLSLPQDWTIGEPSEMADFWTTPYPFALLPVAAPALADSLKQSKLVIFKGDLNYRKLTADVQWPASTPFIKALGPLAGLFPILSLRTSKADVVVGITEAVAEKLQATDPKWRVNGKYALISFCAKN